MTPVEGERLDELRRHFDATTIPRRAAPPPSLSLSLSLSLWLSLFLRLIILNHNHARSSRRSDRLRFIAGINARSASQRAARISSASRRLSSSSSHTFDAHVGDNNIYCSRFRDLSPRVKYKSVSNRGDWEREGNSREIIGILDDDEISGR